MESVYRYCHTLDKQDFDRLSKPIQTMFYAMAIYCNIHNKGKLKSVNHTLKHYDHLLLNAGIFDRIDMTKLAKIKAEQFIPDYMKGRLKRIAIQDRMNTLKCSRNDTVYFYDDVPETVRSCGTLGINSILVDKGLEPEHLELLIQKKQHDSKSVKLVLVDFDKTLSRYKIKKQSYNHPVPFIVESFMGGYERMNKIFEYLKQLEQMGVKIGIVTLNVKTRIGPLLKEIGWLI